MGRDYFDFRSVGSICALARFNPTHSTEYCTYRSDGTNMMLIFFYPSIVPKGTNTPSENPSLNDIFFKGIDEKMNLY